jgi:hypothetical protein
MKILATARHFQPNKWNVVDGISQQHILLITVLEQEVCLMVQVMIALKLKRCIAQPIL